MDNERRTFNFTADSGTKFRVLITAEYGSAVILFFDPEASGRFSAPFGTYTGASYFVRQFREFSGGLSLRIESPRFDLSARDVKRVQAWLTEYASRFNGLPVTLGEVIGNSAGMVGVAIDASDASGDWEVMTVTGTGTYDEYHVWTPIGDVIRVEHP